jgi:hypothetical protein
LQCERQNQVTRKQYEKNKDQHKNKENQRGEI